jgi:hypothetical protein
VSTNTWTVYDELKPVVHSLTVVHPPYVGLIVRAQVKTDQRAALALAQLLAKNLLPARSKSQVGGTTPVPCRPS